MSQGDVKDRMATGGSEVATGTPEQLAAKLKSDDTKMRKLFKDIGLSPGAFGVSGIFTGAALVFFAYIGFDIVATAAEETKNPQRDMPIGIFASLGICTVLYVAVSLVVTGMVKYTDVKVERVQMKSVEIPPSMQRAMAQEAEALREKRARLIKAEAELAAAEQLRNAAEVIMQNPSALELRRMQMITEVGAEQNTMTIVMMPSEFVSLARSLTDLAGKVAAKS